MTQAAAITQSRSAHAAIAGYEYQFDKTAISLLASDPQDLLEIEGIEDVDLHSSSGNQAVQVKYFAGQDYVSPKTLRKPLHLMLEHFKTGARWSYVLYVHFGNFRDMPDRFDVAELKKSLTYVSKTKGTIKLFAGLGDDELADFCSRVQITRGGAFAEQERELIEALMHAMGCDEDEVAAIHVAKAREFVHSRAMSGDSKVRTVTRRNLIDHLNVKDLLFDKWRMAALGVARYRAAQKRQLRASGFHDPVKKRAVYIWLTELNLEQVSDLCRELAGRYLGRMKNAQPWVVILDGDAEFTLRLKIELIRHGVGINDGHESLEFQPSAFVEQPVVNTLGAGNKIKKASFALRVVSRTNFETVDPSTFKIARLISIGSEQEWMTRLADQVITLRHFEPAEYKQLVEEVA